VLARVRRRGDSFVVVRTGDAVARISPLPEHAATSLAEALSAWREAGPADDGFADDLERVGARDQPPELSWAS
jgi:antitoxin (DNA-binding transcriptional repressor) of toxin-antitoxin stability system